MRFYKVTRTGIGKGSKPGATEDVESQGTHASGAVTAVNHVFIEEEDRG
jgi:hypothetical protein